MQLLAALCYLIALLPVGLSAVQPPEYFLIRSKVILRGSKEYYKLYLSSYPNGDESYTPIFLKTYQGGVQFFSLTKPRTTGNTTFYSLELARDQPTIAKMAYDVSRYAFWQPLIFNTIEKNAQPTEMQTGFYIDGEGKDMQLMWTDQVEAVPGISKGWLGECFLVLFTGLS